MKLSQSTTQNTSWLTRAEEAYDDFCKKDAAQTTEAQLWENIAREYDLPEKLEEFIAKRNRLKNGETTEKSLLKAEIQKTPRDFFKLKKAWRSFYNKYGPRINSGESKRLWEIFCSEPGAEKWGALKHEPRLVWDGIRKDEVKEIVKCFGLSDFEDYKKIVRDEPFMESLSRKAQVNRVLNKKY